MVKKVINNLDLSKASGPDFIPVVILKNCESFIHTGKTLKYVSEGVLFYIQIVGRSHLWPQYLRMLGKGL